MKGRGLGGEHLPKGIGIFLKIIICVFVLMHGKIVGAGICNVAVEVECIRDNPSVKIEKTHMSKFYVVVPNSNFVAVGMEICRHGSCVKSALVLASSSSIQKRDLEDELFTNFSEKLEAPPQTSSKGKGVLVLEKPAQISTVIPRSKAAQHLDQDRLLLNHPKEGDVTERKKIKSLSSIEKSKWNLDHIIISPDVKRYQEYLRVLKTSFDQEFPNKTGNSPRTRVLASSPSIHKRENSEDKPSSGPTPLPVKLEAPPQTSSSKGKGVQQVSDHLPTQISTVIPTGATGKEAHHLDQDRLLLTHPKEVDWNLDRQVQLLAKQLEFHINSNF
nr:hypothetical protein Iba_chr12bCG8040 [Ipomoea batatas]